MYTIHNKLNGADLVHPRTGLWTTPSIDDANDMLAACHEYLVASGLETLIHNFIVRTIEGQEILS